MTCWKHRDKAFKYKESVSEKPENNDLIFIQLTRGVTSAFSDSAGNSDPLVWWGGQSHQTNL